MTIPIKITKAGAYLSRPIPFGLSFGKRTGKELRKLIYWAEVEAAGKRASGIASEFVMDFWFDKKNSLANFEAAMSQAASHAIETVQKHYNGKLFKPFTAARDRGDEFRNMAISFGTTRLALQMVEAIEGRAVLDALSRAHNQNALDFILQHNGFDLHEMGDDIAKVSIGQILCHSSSVPSHLPFRHTVGLPDVISEADEKERGQSLEAEIKKYSLNRFKVKINNNVDESIKRLRKMAEVIEKHVGTDYVFTIDGNEAFDSWDDLLEFAEKFTTDSALSNMVRNTSYIEQPFNRDNLTRIDDAGRCAIEKLKSKYKLSILIDESGDEYNSYRFAIKNGITGGGFKLCKGVYKAIFDAATALAHGEGCFNSAEDLTVAEPSDFPQAIHLFSTMKAIRDAELNGAFKTESGIWLTESEKRLAVEHMPSLYYLDGDRLKVRISGNQYPTEDVLGIGLGSPVVCFEPSADVPHLRREIRYID